MNISSVDPIIEGYLTTFSRPKMKIFKDHQEGRSLGQGNLPIVGCPPVAGGESLELHRALVFSPLHFTHTPPLNKLLKVFSFTPSPPELNALTTPSGVTVEQPNTRCVLVQPFVEITASERNEVWSHLYTPRAERAEARSAKHLSRGDSCQHGLSS